MNSVPSEATFFIRVPFELLAHRDRHAPPMCEPELRQDCVGSGVAKVFDQVLTVQTHRDGIEQERAMPGEISPPSASRRKSS